MSEESEMIMPSRRGTYASPDKTVRTPLVIMEACVVMLGGERRVAEPGDVFRNLDEETFWTLVDNGRAALGTEANIAQAQSRLAAMRASQERADKSNRAANPDRYRK